MANTGNNYKNSALKYVRDFNLRQTKTATFTFSDYLTKRRLEDDKPNEAAPYSRVVVTILDNEKKESVKANIPEDEVPVLVENYMELCSLIKNKNAVRDMLMSLGLAVNSNITKAAQSGGVSNSKPEPKIYSIKEFSGMTPSQIIKSNPANKEKLIQHITILEQNLSKYPNNAKVIKAINDAVNNIDKANASVSVVPVCNTIHVIYDSKIKYFREQKDGKHKCYSVNISYEEDKDYPVTVKIANFFCAIDAKNDGTTVIQYKTRSDEKVKVFRFTEDDFKAVVLKLKSVYDNFRMIISPEQRAIIEANAFVPVSAEQQVQR